MFQFIKDKKFFRSIIALAIPIALQNLITAILNIFDQVMVGWLPAEIADFALSAVLLANQVVFIFQIINFAACNTVNIFIAQYTEGGNRHLIPQRVGLVLLLNTSLALVFNVVCAAFPSGVLMMFSPDPSYAQMAADFLRAVSFSFVPGAITITLSFTLRAVKKMKIPLFANLIGVVCNVILNYVFMFGVFGSPAFGLVGAAYGTIVSRCIELGILLVCLIVTKSEILASPKKMFAADGHFAKLFFKNFFPILCNEIFWVLSSTAYLFVYDKLPSSEVALAATNIANAVDKIISVAMIGIGSAIGIVMSNVLATGDMDAIRTHKTMAIQFALFTGLLIALVTFGVSFVAPYCFKNISAETHTTSVRLIWLYALFAVFRTLNFAIIVGILRSGGDSTFCMLCETPAIWLVSAPLVFVGGLVLHLNILWLFTLSSVSEIVKLIIFYLRSRGTRWIKLSGGGLPASAPAGATETTLAADASDQATVPLAETELSEQE